jgi:Rrf2 family transcriptional regulator, nitric oxide-sensitive transcriptional repressor
MISQTAEYALRAIVDLAFHHGESRTTQEISRATQVPADYLAKILQDLSRGGLVRSQRGPGGGFTLTRSPASISVFDVLEAVDRVQRIRTCPLGLKAHAKNLCPLHRRLDEAMERVEKVFRKTMIAEVTAEPDPARNGHRGAATLTISGGLRSR